ncbi:MAG: hypothetical protein QGI33_08140, partial [Candidatus Brocadiia bacterium]|nr:hypothetical protein [Candidatus Brocadiia bacterium]
PHSPTLTPCLCPPPPAPPSPTPPPGPALPGPPGGGPPPPADDASAIAALRAASTYELRQGLLALNGIGPETADSILLYALEKPVFVVDAYTVRIMSRHGLVDPEVGYEEVQAVFEDGLERDVELFKDFHAQLVEVGKRYCRRRSPRCESCPLRGELSDLVLEEW